MGVMETWRCRWKLFLSLLLAVPCLAFAQESPLVRDIRVERTNVFDPTDPTQNRAPYTWVNKLHLVTREDVVRREILLRPGDAFDPYLKDQSARNLRAYAFLKGAQIEAVAIKGSDNVDLVVHTQDTWTTELSPAVGTVGGKSHYGFLVQERNLLGLGKDLELDYTDGLQGIDRSVHYTDGRVFGSRVSFDGGHSDNAHGYGSSGSLSLPAYSLLAPFAMNIQGSHFRLIEDIFSEGAIANEYRHERKSFEVSREESLVATRQEALRFSYGYKFAEDIFIASGSFNNASLPENRSFRTAKMGLSYVRAKYIAENFVGRFDRVDDFNLGFEGGLSLGYSARLLGAPRDTLLPALSFQIGRLLGPGRFMTISADTTFRYESGDFRHIIQGLNVNYYRKNSFVPNNTIVAHGEIARGIHMDGDSQLMLGGDSGLRGYRLHAFAGTRSLMANVEDRLYLVNDWLHVVSLAPVVFWDAGYVWPTRQGAWQPKDLKHDVGFGMRFGFPRSASFSAMRMDISYALNSAQAPNSRWLFSLAVGHAFRERNNSLKKALPQ